MLYQYLLDEVGRKQLRQPDQEVEMVHSPSGEAFALETELVRSRSSAAPRKKDAYHLTFDSDKQPDTIEDQFMATPREVSSAKDAPQSPLSPLAPSMSAGGRSKRLTF